MRLRPNICDTFQLLAMQTWGDLKESVRLNMSLSETSITDFLLLDLVRSHPSEIACRKFTPLQEGMTTGADWEWWFGAKDGWFGMRVQAKKLDYGSRRYARLNHVVRGTKKRQLDLLIDDAHKRRLYPMYCFYNHWDTRALPIPPRCRSYSPRDEYFGCTVASAEILRPKILAASDRLDDILPESLPWMCLVCCHGFSRGNDSLPFRARVVIARMLRGAGAVRNETIPEVIPEAPHYVRRLLELSRPSGREVGPEELESPGNVDGILVIQETPDEHMR